MRNAQLLCWVLFIAGALTSAFAIIWSEVVYHDMSQFLLTFALGIVMMSIAQVGQVVLKQARAIEDLNNHVVMMKQEAFDFEGWVRDKLK